MITIGFDTSNYTTSVACFDGSEGVNCSQLLPVQPGQLGLRQSDAVFSHIKSLPELSDRLFSHVKPEQIGAIGVSTRPRAVEGSYMPCFLVGLSHARTLADALHVPLVEISHQQGHVASCLWSAGRLDLLDEPHLAWHLSGGTTELLLVEPMGKSVSCVKLGGTMDISAGQLIDRTGKLLSLPFPAGKALDALSQEEQGNERFRVRCTDMYFSLSGVENKVQLYSALHTPAQTARYALGSICHGVVAATKQAMERFPGLEVVISGGVSSNTMLRQALAPFDVVYGEPAFATDNAMGPAILAHRQEL